MTFEDVTNMVAFAGGVATNEAETLSVLNALGAMRYIAKRSAQKNRLSVGTDEFDITSADLQEHRPVIFSAYIL